MGGLVPLGYDKGDNGLIINSAEAETVRKLFKTYRDVGCVRRLKDFADGRQLQTKARTTKDGRCIAAKSFSRGRLYHLLSNPIYLGKIKHKEVVYEGLHDAIIDVDLWDKVHTQLTGNAVSRKTRQNAKNPSPLAGKVVDAMGRKLTPTHASKAGKRYRYYVSMDSIGSEAASWRLPAAELEDAVRTALARHVDLQHTLERTSNDQDLMSCVTRVQIHEEHLVITARVDGVSEPYLITSPFTIRRRGIETRLVLGHTTSRAVDIALIKRLLRASDWVDKIKSGASITSIAADEKITPEYITHNIDLAYLSPKVLTAILEGRQRPDISAYQLSKMQIPTEWQAQESLFLL